jgi:hypothetical protein
VKTRFVSSFKRAIWMPKIFAVLLWSLTSIDYWLIALLGAGFAGNLGAIIVIGTALALWLPATALLTDWLGLTRLWPHNR